MLSGSELEVNSSDIPEWKKLLIMRKRAGNLSSGNADDSGRPFPRAPVSGNANTARNGGYAGDKCTSGYANKFTAGRPLKHVDSEVSGSLHDATPPKKVTRTIGNINVELRSVSPKSSIDSPEFCSDSSRFSVSESYSAVHESDDDDLQYGPGIVDRLRARFLNMGAKKQRKPVVRRFSSLENLPGSHSGGPYRPRGVRQNGKTAGHYHHNHGNVKKAQSMETLLSTTPEQQVIASSRRPGARGVKGRIMAKNASLVCADENDEPDEVLSPSKSGKRWEYCRSASAPSINENELPKPDTVKQVKKMFESEKSGSSSGNVATGGRFRKIAHYGNSVSATSPSSKPCNGAGLGNGIEEVCEEDAVETAKCNGAKEELSLDLGVLASPVQNSETYRFDYSPVSPRVDSLSPANESPGTLAADDNDDEAAELGRIEREESEESFIVVEQPAKVTHERSPEISPVDEEREILHRPPSREETCGEEEQQTLVAEISEDEEGGETQTIVDGMVVASSAADGSVQKPWQAVVKKPPQSTTSIVFDFRGKDVKPNISLNPTPFGCRPAKVSRRAGSPPRGPDSPDSPPKVNGVKDYLDDYDDDDWDEMDIGADLPAICGIVFDGENVKVGRGALLETRNKKLSIQFDDGATSTFEYPCEVSSPGEENGYRTEPDSPLKPSIAITSPANSRLGLSHYTPQALSSSEDFELGVSRPSKPLPKVPAEEDSPTAEEELLPAEEAAGWSSAETADILF